MKLFLYTFPFLFFLGVACRKNEPNIQVIEIDEAYFAGGQTTSFLVTNTFITPASNLSQESQQLHMEGNITFDRTYGTTGPGPTSGLGPLFNETTCANCHALAGRAAPPDEGQNSPGLLIKLSVPGTGEHNAPLSAPGFGIQLQSHSTELPNGEAELQIDYVYEVVQMLDGNSVQLKKPEYSLTDAYTAIPADLLISPRIAPAVFGAGLLQAIPDQRLQELSDEFDGNGDGISGKVNLVWDEGNQQMVVGRFGWKASSPNMKHLSALAYHQDMGLTSELFPEENCAGQSNCIGELPGIPEIDPQVLQATEFFCRTLAVPAPRSLESVRQGQQLFEDIQCASCHVPRHVTFGSDILELSEQIIYPYSDLLLHDMGDGLADQRPEFKADGREWRTPPLWGIGLIDDINGHSRFLHDGRARNLEEAILWHGGEAESSKEAYMSLSEEERNALIDFLKAL